MADVTYTRTDYDKALFDWRLVDDVCEGERKIKDVGEVYLPKPNPNDRSEENRRRYLQYLERAVFYNATGRTLEGLVGAVFRKDPIANVPTAISYIETDIDGAGVSVYQQSQGALSEVLKKGRFALYVDMPNHDGDVSKFDLQRGNIRATVNVVSAENVKNWQVSKVGAVYKLSLVVIYELSAQVTEDGFGEEDVEKWRVLRLVDGVVTVQVWQSNDDGVLIMTEDYTPRDGKGKPWDVIPFIFIGAKNNDAVIDKAPLYDLARLNIAHYRNSADYEDSAFFVGQAQPWISGLDTEWRDHLEKDGIYIGSRSPVLLPEGGAFGFAQAQPNTLVKEAMDTKEKQMVALGARLIDRGQAVKTATEAQSENEAEHSVLSLAASNVSEAYTQALEWACRYMAASENECLYNLNKEFVESTLDAQMLTALVGAWQSGKLPSSDFWANLKKYGIIGPEKDDEEIKAELESETAGLGLDDGE